MVAAVVDDLEVEFCPGVLGEERLKVSLGLGDIFAFCELPAFGEAVDVSVNGEGGGVERLDHDDGCRLVSDSGEGLEVV